MITHPCLNFNGGLTKPPLKLGHRWVITSNGFLWVWSLIRGSVEFKAGLDNLCLQKRPLLYVTWGISQNVQFAECPIVRVKSLHDDVIKWKHFPRYWPFVRGIHRSPVNSPHKGQWRGALIVSLFCDCINSWVNNRVAGDLRRHRAHYDAIVMTTHWKIGRQ